MNKHPLGNMWQENINLVCKPLEVWNMNHLKQSSKYNKNLLGTTMQDKDFLKIGKYNQVGI